MTYSSEEEASSFILEVNSIGHVEFVTGKYFRGLMQSVSPNAVKMGVHGLITSMERIGAPPSYFRIRFITFHFPMLLPLQIRCHQSGEGEEIVIGPSSHSYQFWPRHLQQQEVHPIVVGQWP